MLMLCVTVCHLGFFVLVAFVGPAVADPATPGVEVKFFLDPSVALDRSHRPTHDVLTAFRVSKAPVKIRMQFLDSRALELHKAGWNVRLRTVGGKDCVELNYKRRYPVTDGIDATLTLAASEGFDAGEGDYEPELEWGYEQQTLTFSNEKTQSCGSKQLTLPSAKNARTMAIKAMPGKLQRFKDDGWAKGILAGAKIYGPAEGWRWIGSHPEVDDKIAIEVWALTGANGTRTERIVEVSFKKKQLHDSTLAARTALRHVLDQNRWLLDKDVLKTTLILKGNAGSNR